MNHQTSLDHIKEIYAQGDKGAGFARDSILSMDITELSQADLDIVEKYIICTAVNDTANSHSAREFLSLPKSN